MGIPLCVVRVRVQGSGFRSTPQLPSAKPYIPRGSIVVPFWEDLIGF